jgi:hypothetical protein
MIDRCRDNPSWKRFGGEKQQGKTIRATRNREQDFSKVC